MSLSWSCFIAFLCFNYYPLLRLKRTLNDHGLFSFKIQANYRKYTRENRLMLDYTIPSPSKHTTQRCFVLNV